MGKPRQPSLAELIARSIEKYPFMWRRKQHKKNHLVNSRLDIHVVLSSCPFFPMSINEYEPEFFTLKERFILARTYRSYLKYLERDERLSTQLRNQRIKQQQQEYRDKLHRTLLKSHETNFPL
jgi:hypothetical protein